MLEDRAVNSTRSRGESSQSSQQMLEADVYNVMALIDKTAVSSCISLIGIVTNIINIIVFVRQKFSDAVNVSLCGVAVADVGGLCCLLWSNLGSHPWLIQFVDLPYDPYEFLIFTAGHFRVCFARVSCWITAYITIQRCLCVSIPLKVKLILTPRLTAIVVLIIFVVVFFLITVGIFFTGAAKIDLKFYGRYNRTLLGVIFSEDWSRIYPVSSSLISFVELTSFFTIIVSTAVLVVSLNRKTKWRDNTALKSGQIITKRDRSLSKFVISLSTILIACYFPGTAGVILSYIFPQYNIFGKEENMYLLTWAFSVFLESTKSSVNIFVYYKMSSKYRRTFNKIFYGHKKSVAVEYVDL